MRMRVFPKTVGTVRAALLAGAISLACAGIGQAGDTKIQVGILNCTVFGGTGFIIGSSKDLTCTFKGADGSRDRYAGTIRKFGIDIGTTNQSYITWAVFAPSTKVPFGALAGSYGGISAEATLGAGFGANALIGGFEESVALQPLSVQTQSGLNIAAGIASLDLRAR